MAETENIRALLLASKKAAARQMELIREKKPLTYAYFHDCLRRYVLEKYMLTDADCPADEDFNEIVETSLSKSMKVSKSLVEEFDTARSCDGATSAMAKKVLLFMAIQRDLGIELPATESARIKTMSDLTRLAFDEMRQSEQWKGVIED